MLQHAGYSGYSQLVRYINGKKIDLKYNDSLLHFVPSYLKNKFTLSSGLVWFNKDRLATECSAILKMFIKRRENFHFIYGENSYRYSGWFSKFRGNKIVCTYHLPPSIFIEKVQYTKHIQKLDAIVVVASNQIEFFTQFIPRERIYFVPHGIDTDFFNPSIPFLDREDKVCLFVGDWLRDFKTLKEVICIVHSKDSSIQFVIVISPENFEYFKDMEGITLKTNLTDAELLRYYQKATIFLQPIIDCTANNTILEALACELPIIATDVGGIRDYVDKSCAILVPFDASETMAEEIIRLLQDKSRRQSMSKNARNKALDFSWRRIAEKLEKVYIEVMQQ